MKLTHVLLFAGTATGAYFMGTASADSAELPATTTAFLGRFEQMPGPKKEHKYLAQFAGDWNVKAKLTMGPGSEIEMTGKTSARIACNGTWLISDLEGEMMGMQYHGHAVQGWDPVAKRYVGTWFDMSRNGIDAMVGEVNGDGVLVSEGLIPNPWMPMAKIKAKSWFKPGKDKFTYIEKITDGKGGWKPWMVVEHTRVKSDHEHADGHEHEGHDRMHEHGR